MDIDIFQIPGILKRRWPILALTAALCLAGALFYVLSLKPSYSSYTQILLDPKALSADAGESRTALTAAQPDPASIDSQIYVVQSSAVLGEVIRDLDLTKDPALYKPKPGATLTDDEVMAATMAGLFKRMKVERQGQSLIMAITVEHPVAQTAADIANKIASVYLKQLDEARVDAARRASSAFQVQASELRDRVLKAEMAVEQFKSDNGLASTADKGLVIDQQLAGLNDQLIAARGTEEQQRAIYEQTRNLTIQAIESGAIPEAVQSTSIGLLRDRYVQLLDRQAEATTNLGANHPQLRAITSQVASMRAAIEQELDRVRQSMKANYERASANTKALAERLDGLTRSSFDSGEKQIKLRQLESEADAVRTIYKAFLNRAEELSQQQTIAINNSRVITEAVATPKSLTVLKIMILAAAGLFGVALGSALAVFLELTRRPAFAAATASAAGATVAMPQAAPVAATPPPPTAFLPVPVLADARAPAAPRLGLLRSLSGRLTRRLVPRQEAESDAEGRFQHAVANATRFLLDCVEGDGRVSVLFVAVGKPGLTAGFLADLVHRLADRDRSLLYAPGALLNRVPPRRHAVTEANSAEPPLASHLKYQPFGPLRTATGTDGRPSFARYLGRAGTGQEDFILINACLTPAETYLMPLAEAVDMILVLADTDEDAALQLLLQQLGKDADRVVGRILLEPQP